jgi:hypothetical protein
MTTVHPNTVTPRWSVPTYVDHDVEELHPSWCAAEAGPCGVHYGDDICVPLLSETDSRGECPDFTVAPIMDAAGQPGVKVEIGRFYQGVPYMTPDEARTFIAAIEQAVQTATTTSAWSRRPCAADVVKGGTR